MSLQIEFSSSLSAAQSTIHFIEGKGQNAKYVYITKKRLTELEYIEKNISTIIATEVLKSEIPIQINK